MTSLVAVVGEGSKGTWKHVEKVIEGCDWEKIFLLVNDEANSSFQCSKKTTKILIDSSKTTTQLIDYIKTSLEAKINDLEVALNMISGNGKEHMALLCALQKLGLGIRMVALTEKGVKEIAF